MKTTRALFFALFAIIFASGIATAQGALTPEFRLNIHYTDTTVSGTGFTLSDRAIGYDPLATDGYDEQFGEDDDYPGSVQGFHDFYFVYPDTGALHTRVDIRHKSAEQSFSIDYRMEVKFDYAKGLLYWDPTKIPSAVHAIWIRPYTQQDTLLADMTKDSTLKVPLQQALNWSYTYLVTLFYNMTPPPLAVSGDRQSIALLSNLSAYPNPIRQQGKISMQLSEPAKITLTGFDETGRECLRQVEQVLSGNPSIPLQNIESLHGSILLHVEAVSASRTESRNILVVKD